MTPIETEMIDRLFLELSQITTAQTPKELKLRKVVGLLDSMVKSGESHSADSLRLVDSVMSVPQRS